MARLFVDTFNYSGAVWLARKIEAYWKTHGLPDIKARVVQHEVPAKAGSERSYYYVVRSNLVIPTLGKPYTVTS